MIKRAANTRGMPARTNTETTTRKSRSVPPSAGSAPAFQVIPWPVARLEAYRSNIAASSAGGALLRRASESSRIARPAARRKPNAALVRALFGFT